MWPVLLASWGPALVRPDVRVSTQCTLHCKIWFAFVVPPAPAPLARTPSGPLHHLSEEGGFCLRFGGLFGCSGPFRCHSGGQRARHTRGGAFGGSAVKGRRSSSSSSNRSLVSRASVFGRPGAAAVCMTKGNVLTTGFKPTCLSLSPRRYRQCPPPWLRCLPLLCCAVQR